ncbi:MAG: TIGR01777 family oxidoreductase [Pseudomonadales bacterium]|nr:TIGR01777 family oxidoreductase [Pseudomonadales bacterium]NRA16634.1 TIGR01777 family protein [Oceanospirillaceae bacterium]
MASYLITGGTGLIGSALIERLLTDENQVSVLTRDPQQACNKLPNSIKFIRQLHELPRDYPIDYVINLAGEPIADKRWSKAQKKKLWSSRITLTVDLVAWLKQQETLPKALISGSAVGWYGDSQDRLLTERSSPASEYTHTLCQAWEQAASGLTDQGVRVCLFRTGLVVSDRGGFLDKLLLPFKFGLGARLGDGCQYMSWIHIEDMVRALIFLIDDQKADNPEQSRPFGVYNLTSPAPVTNRTFTKTLAKQLGRPAFLIAPELVLRLLLGEMAGLLITGQRVKPEKLLTEGFSFHYPTLDLALINVLR